MSPTIAFERMLLVVAIALATSSLAHAQANCDCSCESYAALQDMAEQMQAQSASGQPRQLPPELMQMSMCAQTCAQTWAQCAMGKTPRPQAAAGQEAIDQERRIHEAQADARRQETHGDESESDEPHADDEPVLSEDYLAGTWCSIYGGRETTQWQFNPDGSYEFGLPAGNGWAMQPGGGDLDAFRERFERVIAIGDDRFVTEHRHGRNNVFTRGPC